MDVPLPHHPGPDEPVPNEQSPTTSYVVYDDGSFGAIETNGDEPPALSKPGRLVDEEEYLAVRLAWETARAQRRDELEAADAARLLEDCLALRAAGIPAETARRLSGYTGPFPHEDGPLGGLGG